MAPGSCIWAKIRFLLENWIYMCNWSITCLKAIKVCVPIIGPPKRLSTKAARAAWKVISNYPFYSWKVNQKVAPRVCIFFQFWYVLASCTMNCSGKLEFEVCAHTSLPNKITSTTCQYWDHRGLIWHC